MIFDLSTLIAVYASGFAAAACLLAFYRRYLKTYDGFDRWLAGSVLIAAGTLAIALRQALPLALSVLGGQAAIGVGALLRLDGTTRFLRGRPVHPALWGGPFIYLAAIAWFLFVRDDFGIRTFIFSSWIAFCAFAIALECLRAAPPATPALHRGAALLFATHGAVSLARAAYILHHRDYDLFHPDHPSVHIAYFAGLFVLEFACSLGLLLLTAQRVEAETAAEVDRTVETLDRLAALREDADRLGGILPVCFDCRRMRDDAGRWSEAGRHIEARSAARFLDSLCPDCAAGERQAGGAA